LNYEAPSLAHLEILNSQLTTTAMSLTASLPSCFHFERHRQRFIVARGVLRYLLGRYFDVPPETSARLHAILTPDERTRSARLTPFKVFIPEKRQFFLDNAGVFNFDIGDEDQLFFSRQIGIDPLTGQQVPINGGAKLTGKFGQTEVGLMDVDTRSSGPNPFAKYAVARVKESLWGGSYNILA